MRARVGWVLWGALALISCDEGGGRGGAAAQTPQCVGSKCDNAGEGGTAGAGGPCAVDNESPRADWAISDNDDPLASLLRDASLGCPVEFDEVIDGLSRSDSECSASDDATITYFVSHDQKRAQSVTTRRCGDGDEHHIFFSQFAHDLDGIASPPGAEVMALDRETGLYNFYGNLSGHWRYFGNSDDIETTPGIRCHECHDRGQLVMDRQPLPQIDWEQPAYPLAGPDLIENTPALGKLGDPRDLAAAITKGNRALRDARISADAKAETVDYAKLLEPLFCPTEIKIYAAGYAIEGDTVVRAPSSQLPASLFVHPYFGIEETVPVDPEELEAAVPFDEHFGFRYEGVSPNDVAAIDALVAGGFITQALADAVLLYDFTNPMSQARCDLLNALPGGVGPVVEPRLVREAVIDAVQVWLAEGYYPDEGQLRALLEDLEDFETGAGSMTQVRDELRAYLEVCRTQSAADPRYFAQDVAALADAERRTSLDPAACILR